jgi:hypothetical protein
MDPKLHLACSQKSAHRGSADLEGSPEETEKTHAKKTKILSFHGLLESLERAAWLQTKLSGQRENAGALPIEIRGLLWLACSGFLVIPP